MRQGAAVRPKAGGVLGRARAADAPVYEYLFAAGIMLLPYDGFRVMPSVYRPVSVFLFALAMLFVFGDGNRFRLQRRHQLLASFYLYALLSTCVACLALRFDVSALADSVLTLTIGFVTFLACSHVLSAKVREVGLGRTVDWLMGLLSKAYVVPLAVGAIELLSLNGILPHAVKQALMGVFGGWQEYRLCITSPEASWASVQMIVALCVYGFMYRRDRRGRYLAGFAASGVLFFSAASLQGFLVLFAAAAITAVWYSVKTRRLAILLGSAAVLALSCGLVYAFFLYLYDAGDRSYFVVRVVNFVNLDALIHSDGSAFTRLVSPLIGLMMFVKAPFLGVGGGSYSFHYPEYIYSSFPWALSFPETHALASGAADASAFCLYARVLAEFGLVGGALFFAFLLVELKGIGRVYSACSKPWWIVLLVVGMLCVQLQFASFAHVPFWLFIALLDAALSDEGGLSRRIEGQGS